MKKETNFENHFPDLKFLKLANEVDLFRYTWGDFGIFFDNELLHDLIKNRPEKWMSLYREQRTSTDSDWLEIFFYEMIDETFIKSFFDEFHNEFQDAIAQGDILDLWLSETIDANGMTNVEVMPPRYLLN